MAGCRRYWEGATGPALAAGASSAGAIAGEHSAGTPWGASATAGAWQSRQTTGLRAGGACPLASPARHLAWLFSR